MKICLKRALACLLCVVTVLSLSCVFTACSQDKSPVLLSYENLTVTENQFKFLLSRAKANYERMGLSEDNYDDLIDLDGTTRGDYIMQQVLHDAKLMIAGAALFEQEGLTLPAETVDAIETEVAEYIEYHGDGSKSAFNNILSAYSFNVTMLENQYLFEAKYQYVQDYLYGENGSKLAPSATQEFLNDNAVAFKQLLIRSYKYVYEKDVSGDEIYYLTDANDGQTDNIAYDKIKGSTRIGEDGKVITDKNGDSIYFLENGDIAYDKEKGVRAVMVDATGNLVTELCSSEELAENKEIAEKVKSSVEKGDFLAFEQAVKEYTDKNDERFTGDNSYCFLYTTGDNGYDELNDIADALSAVEVGDVTVVNSEHGYNIVMRYDIPEDATANKDYEEWFTDLNARVVNYLFRKKCADIIESIQVDEDVFAALPDMKNINANYNY